MRPRRGDSTRPVDLGWLFLLPGIALLAAGVLIAAEDDVYEARFHRDQALAIERRHADRVERYRAYLEALERQDPTVVRSLVVTQLNAAPTDLVEEPVQGAPVYDATEVFSALEPEPAEAAERVRVDSVLARWATRNESRMWLLASGALCVFVGLLPPASRRRGWVGIAGGQDPESGVISDDDDGTWESSEDTDDGGGGEGGGDEDDPEARAGELGYGMSADASDDEPADEWDDSADAGGEESEGEEDEDGERESDDAEAALDVEIEDEDDFEADAEEEGEEEGDEAAEEDGEEVVFADSEAAGDSDLTDLTETEGGAIASEAATPEPDAEPPGPGASTSEDQGGSGPGLFDTLRDGSSGPRA